MDKEKLVNRLICFLYDLSFEIERLAIYLEVKFNKREEEE